jgi:hypothetical protein
MILPKKKYVPLSKISERKMTWIPSIDSCVTILDSEGIAQTANIIKLIFKGHEDLVQKDKENYKKFKRHYAIVVGYEQWKEVIQLCNYLEKKQ